MNKGLIDLLIYHKQKGDDVTFGVYDDAMSLMSPDDYDADDWDKFLQDFSENLSRVVEIKRRIDEVDKEINNYDSVRNYYMGIARLLVYYKRRGDVISLDDLMSSQSNVEVEGVDDFLEDILKKISKEVDRAKGGKQ